MIYMEDANRKQLLQIALHENCSLDYKYEAATELQVRKWRDDMLPELIRLWGQGKSIFEISIEMEIPESTVHKRIQKYNLFGKRVAI